MPGLSALATPLGHASSATRSDLRIGSFNIQVFGAAKVQKPFVHQALISILSRYDIAFIMEIRDDKNQAIFQLLDDLNEATGRGYKAMVSKRLGRGDMKEQYAYFYDPTIVSSAESYVYDDLEDEFSREPFVARFEAQGRSFTTAGIHIAPTDVLRELKALNAVYRDAKEHFGDDNIFIMGDFNADCVYYKPERQGFDYFDVSPLVRVGDDEDTTVAASSCAYDRVLGFGEIQNHASDAHAYNMIDEFGYDIAHTKLISDHFPVEFTISTSGSMPVIAQIPAEAQPPGNASDLGDIIVDREDSVIVENPSGNPLSCGVEVYISSAGYCYGSFEGAKKKRVSSSCCL